MNKIKKEIRLYKLLEKLKKRDLYNQINNVNFCENDENWISGLGNGIYDHGEPFADEILYPGDFNSNKMPNFDPEVLVESEEINFYQVMLGDTKDIDFYISKCVNLSII